MKKSNSRILMALTEKNEDHVIGEDLNQSLNQSVDYATTAATPRGLRNVSSRANLSRIEIEQAKS